MAPPETTGSSRTSSARYVFWDVLGEIRSPKDRDLAPGEFERLYQTLPTVEYIFQNGMTPLDPLIMDRVVQAIREQNPEYDIQIDSISARGLAPSIKFTVRHEKHKEPALAKVKRMYEAKVNKLAGRLEESRRDIQQLIDHPHSVTVHAKYLAIGGSTLSTSRKTSTTPNCERPSKTTEPWDRRRNARRLDVIGGAIEDFAKGQVKEAAKQVYELGKDLGPVIVNTAAYTFFKSLMPSAGCRDFFRERILGSTLKIEVNVYPLAARPERRRSCPPTGIAADPRGTSAGRRRENGPPPHGQDPVRPPSPAGSERCGRRAIANLYLKG